ncbi:MAG: 4Fe-4S binding protein [Desulfovibrionales bacterium]
MSRIEVNELPKKQIVVHIDRGRCDGCALCIDTCPTQALRVIPNRERPGKRVVSVTPKLCEGCGICQATCPKDAIFIPGLSPQDLKRLVAEAIASCENKPRR